MTEMARVKYTAIKSVLKKGDTLYLYIGKRTAYIVDVSKMDNINVTKKKRGHFGIINRSVLSFRCYNGLVSTHTLHFAEVFVPFSESNPT